MDVRERKAVREENAEASPPQTPRPMQRPPGGAVASVLKVVRAVAMWSYVLITLSILWVLCPLLLLNGPLSALGYSEYYMPFETCRRWWVWIALYVGGVSVVCEHDPSVWKERGTILLPNHSSTLDAFIVAGFAPCAPTYIFKRELMWQFPYLFLLGYLMGNVPIDRSDTQRAIKSLNSAAPGALARGRGLVIFPEGTRSDSGRLLPFKKGAFNIAVNEKCSITPIVLLGTHDLWPRRNWFPTPGTVLLRSGPVIKVGEGEGVVPLLERTRKQFVETMTSSTYLTQPKGLVAGTAPAIVWLSVLALASWRAFSWLYAQ